MQAYDVGGELGKGQWGTVFRGKRVRDGLRVAIKRVRAGDPVEGVNFQVLREIKMLKGVKHENIVELVDVVPQEEGLNMIFELMATDLEKVLYGTTPTEAEIKGYAAMLLEGLAFMHAHFALHRDIKPANLLISFEGILKLGDFGYARYLADENCHMSDQCCTLWYRPPELLFGASEYGFGIDTWSAGCVLAEVGLKHPLFRGETDLDQLAKIFQITGPPDETAWPGVSSLRKYIRFSKNDNPLTVRTLLNNARLAPDFVDLIVGLLSLDPKSRDSAVDALDRPFFTALPRPVARPPRKHL
ncbi:hypothetical protein CTAYLR_003194 [Chrysophaeum taylorii]|uniref:Cyclin-dependent kinase 2 homolog n=1 Tax=Chrysophaeum taylorii TaxID=2483200 RepID=A0AAD7UDI5_9STRA|nr:hypothetical protein CTAYLR_003194 [Chrysophaeum taylorii]